MKSVIKRPSTVFVVKNPAAAYWCARNIVTHIKPGLSYVCRSMMSHSCVACVTQLDHPYVRNIVILK